MKILGLNSPCKSYVKYSLIYCFSLGLINLLFYMNIYYFCKIKHTNIDYKNADNIALKTDFNLPLIFTEFLSAPILLH